MNHLFYPSVETLKEIEKYTENPAYKDFPEDNKIQNIVRSEYLKARQFLELGADLYMLSSLYNDALFGSLEFDRVAWLFSILRFNFPTTCFKHLNNILYTIYEYNDCCNIIKAFKCFVEYKMPHI